MPTEAARRSRLWRVGPLRVEWRPSALADHAAIFEYLFERNPMAATTLAEALVVAGDSLSTLPFRGRPGLVHGTRELLIVRPYLVIYEVDPSEDRVIILRVWHGSRDRDAG